MDPHPPSEPTPDFDEESFVPRGTLFFSILFLLLMVAIWGTMYFILLER